MATELTGYLRADGRKGIRDHLLVVYLVEWAKHGADEIARQHRDGGVQLIGFSGCFPNEYSKKMLGCSACMRGSSMLRSLIKC